MKMSYDEMLGRYKEQIGEITRKVLRNYGIIPTPTKSACAYLAMDIVSEISDTGFFANRAAELEEAERSAK